MFKNKRKRIIVLRSLITMLLFFSLIFNSTFHPQNAKAADPSAPIDVNHSLGVASNFNAFILNNMTMPNTDSEGRLAVGNSLNVSSYGIASKLSNNDDVNLVVGNELHYKNGELKGHFVIGENGGPAPIVDVSDYLRAKQVTDKKVSDVQDFVDNQVASFAEARTQLIGISQNYQSYSASQSNGTINKSGSRLTFSYSGSSDFVVFSLSSSEFSQAGEIKFDVPRGKTIVINITGATINWPGDQQFFNGSGMNYGDDQAAKILFNFPDATTINLGNIGIFGSVLAPKATVNASWGQLNGTLIANNFNNTNGSMEVHFALFKPTLPPTTVLGKVTVKKVDAADHSKTLSGAVFDLEKQDGGNWTKVDTLTTGQDGMISKDNLPLGTYRLVETKAPTGYEKGANPPAFDLTKAANEKSITVENAGTPVFGKITVKKVDAANPDKTLSGAVFDLEKQDGGNWTKVDTLTTGHDGKISKDNLPLGTYRLVETKAPTGYEKGANPPAFDLTKAANEKSITVENAETPVFGKITVKKVDAANSDKTLEGAVFDLEKQDGDSWTRVDTLTTGHDGTISKDNLPLGTYRLVETKAPDGYEKEANPQQFDLTKGDNEKTVTVKNTNIPEKVLGTVTLKKVDSANPDQTLEGAVFDLQQLNDSGQWNTLYTLTTDDKGEIEKSGLELGTYRWMEKTAPTGYVLSSKTEQVTLTQNEPKASTIFENTKRPEKVLGTVALKKVDAANPDQALEGAVFNLQQLNESGQWETLYTLTTDDKGEIEKSGLELGTYRWMEKTAPTGYVLSSKTEQVTLTQSDPTSNITFENTKIPEEVFGSLSLKKVDSTNLDQALEGAVFDLQQLNESGQWNTLYTLTTDDKGEIEKSGLELGTYRFVEKTAPTGYVLSSKTEQVTLTQNEPKASTIFENTKRPEEVLGTVALKKVDSSNPDQILEGAIFDLQQLNESGQWNTLYTLTTDDKGEIEKSGLELGTYRWVEKTAPTGYVLSSKTEQVTLTQNEPKASTIFENTKQPEEVLGTVTLKKVDAANPDQALEGAVFDIQQLSESGQWNTLYTLTTDDKGEIEKSGLELGTYRWVEKTAPTGYVLSSKTEQVTLTQSDPKASTIFENTKQPEEVLSTVTLKKVDAANPDQTLEGAVFELQKLNNQSKWETLYTLTTDKNGKITKSGLEIGTYQWVEIQAPTGYALSAKPEQFTLTQSNQQFSITFENTIISETVTPVPPTPPTPSQPIVPLQPLTPAVPSQTPTLERGVMGEEQVQDQPIASEPDGQTPTDQATQAPMMQRGFLAETQYSVPTKESTLPITGDSSNSIVYWFGALLIFAAGIIGFARRRKTKKMR